MAARSSALVKDETSKRMPRWSDVQMVAISAKTRTVFWALAAFLDRRLNRMRPSPSGWEIEVGKLSFRIAG
jgi:hypothetical protein